MIAPRFRHWLPLLTLGCLALNPFLSADPEPKFLDWAPRPPLGWNSWDCFGTTLNEKQAKEQALAMARDLKPFGWEYFVVDIQWYEPGSQGYDYRAGAPVTLDAFGRLMPAPNKFPSSVEGAGFKPLADFVHGLGLKFGIHLMRGIPRRAYEENLPVFGTSFRARDIANPKSICPWNPDMYGVDMSKPGAQAYYDSVFAQIAAWGVDYVKVDDISRPYHEHEKEIEAIRKAIDATGRPIVLSLSPGETALTAGQHVQKHANLWRISDDFWDTWIALHSQFARLAAWNEFRRPGAWPDADMLPLGKLQLATRSTRFTPDEQRTLMTLWSIARSPLMHGGDLTLTDPATLALLTNREVLAVNQASTDNRPLVPDGDRVVWTAKDEYSKDHYVALFNTRGAVSLAPESAAFRTGVLGSKEVGPGVSVDVDLSGATQLVLLADHEGPANHYDHALWIEPTLVMADGSRRSLLDIPWTRAEAIWDQVSAERASSGKPMTYQGKSVSRGIGVRARGTVEYTLPPGAVRLQATAALDDSAREGDRLAQLRLSVHLGYPEGDLAKKGLPVSVSLSDLGFTGSVLVRDLWTGEDLGEITGELTQEIPWHGAGLYRLRAKP